MLLLPVAAAGTTALRDLLRGLYTKSNLSKPNQLYYQSQLYYTNVDETKFNQKPNHAFSFRATDD